jgi:O-antigen ligase
VIRASTTRAGPSSPRPWADRSLDVARGAFIAVGVLACVSTAATSIAVGVFVLAWLGSGRASVLLRATWARPDMRALALFFAWLLAGIVYGASSAHDAWQGFWSWHKLLLVPLAVPLFDDARWRGRFATVLLWTAALVLVLSAVGALVGWQPRVSNPAGVVLQNYAAQSQFLCVALLVAAWRGWIAPRGPVVPPETGAGAPAAGRWSAALGALGTARAACIALSVASVVGILALPGRSGWIGLMVACVAIAWRGPAGRRVSPWVAASAAVAVVVLIASALAFEPHARARATQAWDEWSHAADSPYLTSLGIRRVFWTETAALVAERPIAGAGTGGLRTVYAERIAERYPAGDWRAEPAADPHNLYLLIAAENGVIGLALFALWIVVTLRVALRRAPEGFVAAAALAVWCVTSLANAHFRTFAEGHLLAAVLGVMLAGADRRTRVADASSSNAQSPA